MAVDQMDLTVSGLRPFTRQRPPTVVVSDPLLLSTTPSSFLLLIQARELIPERLQRLTAYLLGLRLRRRIETGELLLELHRAQ